MKTYLKFSLLTLAGMLLFTACTKDKETLKETIESSEDNTKMEGEMNAIFDMVNAVGKSNFGKTAENAYLPPCATVTIDSVSIPKSKTVTFSDPNGVNGACLCYDGIYRKGSIKIEYSGTPDAAGFTRKVTLIDFYSGPTAQTKFTGTKTQVYEGKDTNGNRKYSVKVENGSAQDDNGTLTWKSNREVLQTKGNDTPTILDDAYEVRGTASGTNRKGISYNVAIDPAKPLKKDFDKCDSFGDRFRRSRFIAGVWTLTNESGNTMTMDYDPIGGEPCDRTARVTLNGKSYDIVLR